MCTAIIAITGNRVFQLGERSRVRCSTPLPVESIQWLDESNRVVREGMSVQELVLNLTITAAHNNTRYTCRVSDGSYTGTLSINITTGRKNTNGIKWMHTCNNCHPAPPMVTVSGSGGAQIAGEDYTLTCTVTGGGTTTPTYRWLRNGLQLPDETSAALSFSPLRQSSSNSYTCEATKSLSTVTSEPIVLTVEGTQ